MTRTDDIRAREQAATPGPWAYTTFEDGTASIAYVEDEKGNPLHGYIDPEAGTELEPIACEVQNGADAAFMAHAREDIHFLLDENERQTAQCKALEGALRKCFKDSNWRCHYCIHYSRLGCKNKDVIAEGRKPITQRKHIDCWQFDCERFAGQAAIDAGDPNWIEPQRNAPCACGSGKKYKHCCGAMKKETALQRDNPEFMEVTP